MKITELNSLEINKMQTVKIELLCNVTKLNENGEEITEQIDLSEILKDGRPASYICEYITDKLLPLNKTINSCEKDYDFLDDDYLKYEMKGRTSNGISFTPSYMKGKNRAYCEDTYKKVLVNNDRYIINDISNPGYISFITLDSDFLLKSKEKVIKGYSKTKKIEDILNEARNYEKSKS